MESPLPSLPLLSPPTPSQSGASATADPDDAPALALDRASLERLLADASACSVDRIVAAINRADYDDAAVRALARAKLGQELPPALIAGLLVGVDYVEAFFGLARHLSGEGPAMLLELLQNGWFAADDVGDDQMVYAIFSLWQLLPPGVDRTPLVSLLRHLVRRHRLMMRTAGLVGWLATRLADPILLELHAEHYGDGAAAVLLAATMGRHTLELWNAPLDELLAYLPERAPEPPLPDVPVPVRAAPKAGRNKPCPCGSGQKLKKCCDRPGALPDTASASRAERLRALEPHLERAHIGRLSRADLARLDLSRLREPTVTAIIYRQMELRDWRRAYLAIDELTRRGGKDLSEVHLEAVIFQAIHARRPDIARQLLALHSAGADLSEELAFTMHEPDALEQVEAIEEVRDERELPPGEPAQELLATWSGIDGSEREADAHADAVARARLAQIAAKLRADLERTQAGAGELDALAEELPDEHDAPALPIQIPRFSAAASAAVDIVSRTVAATAMRTVGALAAGDLAAWRTVEQARDMPHQLFVTRVGSHHRLLFRLDAGLDIIDLVTRESLPATLQRLRSR
jgi:hypothetical protein